MSKTIVLSINASWNIVNFRAGLVRGLQEAGYRIVALAPSDRFSPRLTELGVEHVPIEVDPRGTSPYRDLRLLWRYHRLLGRLRPVAYLGYTVKPNVYGSIAAHLHGIPVINNIAGLGETFIGRSWINRLVRGLYRLALRRSTTIFFQNPDDRTLFVSLGVAPADRSKLLPGSGIDLERFSVRVGRENADGSVRFLLVARLLWAKGVADFVEAARSVRSQAPTARFRLLGLIQEGRGAIDTATLERWSQEGMIEFLGGTDDVRPYLADADCVVLPTFYPEGTPRVLLEAAAMGRPLIASNVPGCREIVADGENGFLCPPRDPEALSRAMLRIIQMSEDDRREMGSRSRARAESRFDERIVIREYLEALRVAEGDRAVAAATEALA